MVKEEDVVGLCRKSSKKGKYHYYIIGRLMLIRKMDRRENKKLKYPRYHVRILIGKGWKNNVFSSHYYAIKKETGNTKKIWEQFEEDSIAHKVAEGI